MLSPELKKLMEDLENGTEHIRINREKLLDELHDLDDKLTPLGESLSMSERICRMCGRPLKQCKEKMEDEHMLSPELRKLFNNLRAGEANTVIDWEKLQAELEDLDKVPTHLQDSLSMSTNVCPTCGRKI